jgi:hypothetical protein
MRAFGVFERLVWRVATDHHPSGAETQPAAQVDAGPQASGAPAGSPPSFEAFFHERERAIFGSLYRMTGEEQAAYDLSQETFLRA